MVSAQHLLVFWQKRITPKFGASNEARHGPREALSIANSISMPGVILTAANSCVPNMLCARRRKHDQTTGKSWIDCDRSPKDLETSSRWRGMMATGVTPSLPSAMALPGGCPRDGCASGVGHRLRPAPSCRTSTAPRPQLSIIFSKSS